MLRERTVRASVAVGLVAAGVAAGYGVATEVIPQPTGTAGLPVALLVYAGLLVVPFGVGAGVAFLAVRHRVVLPLAAVAGFAAAPAAFGWHGGLLVVGVLVVGPLVVVLAVAEALARGRLGRLVNPPTRSGWRAISVGVMAAVLYAGVFAIRAVLPLWRIETGAPSMVPPAVNLAVMLWYVLGAALVLVGVPVALNRRFGLLAPMVGLVAFLLVDLAFVQPAVAEGAELVVALLIGVWPTLAVLFAVIGVLEYWLRARRGEYGDEPDAGGGGEGADAEGLTVEGGLFGDRV